MTGKALLLPLSVWLACWLQDELAKSVTTEQGKTFQDAKGDVFRGLGEQGAAGDAACSWLLLDES